MPNTGSADTVTEFLALERAIAPFAEGFEVRSENDGRRSGVFLYRDVSENGHSQEIGIFAGIILDESAYPHLKRVEAPEAVVMAYVSPTKGPVREELVDDEDSVFENAHRTLMPLASPEPFEFFGGEDGALVRTRRLSEDAAELTDRRLLEFCRGSLALLGQVDLLDDLRDFGLELDEDEDE